MKIPIFNFIKEKNNSEIALIFELFLATILSPKMLASHIHYITKNLTIRQLNNA